MLALPPDETGHLTVPVGYNLILDRPMGGFNLNARQAPVLASALRRNRSLRLPSSSTSSDLLSLASALNLTRAGHLLAVPIASPGKSPIMGVVLLSPYSGRGWTAEDQEYLAGLAVSLASILQRMQQFTQQQADLEQARADLETAHAAAERTQQDLQALQAESEHERGEAHDFAALIEDMQRQLQQEHARAESLSVLVATQDEHQQTIADLEARNSELEALLQGATALHASAREVEQLRRREPVYTAGQPNPEVKNLEDQLRLALEDVAILKFALQEADERLLRAQADSHLTPPAASREIDVAHLEEQLRMSLEDVAALKATLQEADERLAHAEAHGGQAGPSAQVGTVVTIAQELRQPVSSIVGYTDLLLSESVGILGATQRKFIERVKASTERLGGLLDEMIQATALESDGRPLNPVAVDLNAVIDEAVKSTLGPLSEKNIALRVDLPEELPPIRADKDALQQVLANLLLNASGATPANGEVSLRARLETKENEPGYMLVQVADAGGGIAPETLPRIFSRLYRSSNPSIPGLGDNGAGLSMVKTLVEAHGGRIWVDSVSGIGATFSVLLPMAEDLMGSSLEGELAA
jgi:signal transduction histidine kinase